MGALQYLIAVCLSGIALNVVHAYTPEQGMSTPDMIQYNGYPNETHTVETEDGYILEMHRIPRGLKCGDKCGQGVVLLMHGLLCNSAVFVEIGPTNSLAYILADQGYDVWIGNARGNPYSKKHKTLDPEKDTEYWNFSFHEIGYYDLPSKIDYILKTTGKEKLSYIGHSQGTTAFFVMASERPEYNKKISSMSAMGPATFMSHMKNKLIRVLAENYDVFVDAAQKVNLKKFMPEQSLLITGAQMLCAEKSRYMELCTNVLFLIAGWDSQQFNETTLPSILSHLSQEASMMQFTHYFQMVNSARFCKYDLGTEKNEKMYGKTSPPDYDLSKVTAPVAVYHSENDIITSNVDAEILIKALPNVITNYNVPLKEFNHVDFVWARDVKELVYNKMLSVMKEHI